MRLYALAWYKRSNFMFITRVSVLCLFRALFLDCISVLVLFLKVNFFLIERSVCSFAFFVIVEFRAEHYALQIQYVFNVVFVVRTAPVMRLV
mgnify:CR=1 FL=1